MDVTVGIPTLGRDSLYPLLRKLKTWKDVEILLVYKGEVKTKDYNRAIEQKDGYYEEAINIIFRESHSSILLITDDDAIPSDTWIQDHVSFHERNEKIGVASGVVEGKKWINYPNFTFQLFKDTVYMEEYDHRFKDYVGYLTKTGLSVDRRPHDSKDLEKTLAIAGVNMSIKKEVYSNLSVPEYSIRGSYNESLIAIEGIKRGYHSAIFNRGKVVHTGEESLSRTDQEWLTKYLAVEKHTFPYAVNFFLKIDSRLLEDFSRRVQGEAKTGLDLALKGILHNMDPHSFREELRSIYLRLKEEGEKHHNH
ncbi:glycosyltransferase family A protein [Sulfolobus acidocaldarius]|uniref:Glycosyltransferase 2-like domain-containing protein n=4 Tax=Sulfolobus acidocaldarius TaxID=2285 RepID=Q4J7A8_SULAC|nr:glycosyltransferase family A protein [Sulfolobus acidocaldarius]AAY81323.1 hypothetical protein Saci_2027 [Sulfolobus acidocaldarius DSM 639]AGE71964.1 hypothetical protein SacN8_10070 [Sulfolobus acidocaldarius N8]AGE74236.1 hypothetical protein SacRon12I_10090 [Sulfolobus acidocaldarius Ron12/I]ALU29875.1 hypothetical protein ATY89_07940 [Sulfolobus acidocaldarius]ALU32615.1 hypothetical protein ATZ20_10960 [Sulfolobus acidocaldarius]